MTIRFTKTKKVLIFILLILELIGCFLIYKVINNKKSYMYSTTGEKTSNNYAIMLETKQDDGTSVYVESTKSDWPADMAFNSELSECVDANDNVLKNILSYDEKTRTIHIKTKTSLYCYIYFDIKEYSTIITISTDGTNNTMPSYNHYKQTLTCENATANFNTKYQRIEISNVNKTNTACNLNYTTDSNSYTLLSTKVQNSATKRTTTNNAGKSDISYRYSGKTPNNWVWFNNEKWRIIGLIPVCTTSNCGTPSTKLVKIIRNDSLKTLRYDAKSDNYTGIWGSNTLYSLLNSYYYGKKDGTNTDYCYGYLDLRQNCDYTNIGISDKSDDYYGRMVKNVYWNTGASNYNITIIDSYKKETATQTVSGKIGLMTVSDYGYAGTNYSSTINTSTFANNSSENWLTKNKEEVTINTYDTNSITVLAIKYNGQIRINLGNNGNTVRPAVYLDSNVYIIGGNGSESDPYILGM